MTPWSPTTAWLAGVSTGLALAVTGCGDAGIGGAAGTLAEGLSWTRMGLVDDPLGADVAADSVPCTERDWREELGGIEVSTEACAYAGLVQPAARAVHVGDVVTAELWWATLASTRPATGHVALIVEDEVVAETHVDIPGPADARQLVGVAVEDHPEGAPVRLHLHNHGTNTWTVAELRVTSGPGDDDWFAEGEEDDDGT